MRSLVGVAVALAAIAGWFLLPSATIDPQVAPQLVENVVETKQLTGDTKDQIIDDLERGRRVVVRSTAEADPAKQGDSESADLLELRSFGPPPPYQRDRLLQKARFKLEQTIAAADSYEGELSAEDATNQAGYIMNVERLKICIELLEQDKALLVENSSIPSLEGWELFTKLGEKLVVDADGNVVQTTSELADKQGELLVRKVNLLYPIKLERYPMYQAARDYAQRMEWVRNEERVVAFNSLPSSERMQRFRLHDKAQAALRAYAKKHKTVVVSDPEVAVLRSNLLGFRTLNRRDFTVSNKD